MGAAPMHAVDLEKTGLPEADLLHRMPLFSLLRQDGAEVATFQDLDRFTPYAVQARYEAGDPDEEEALERALIVAEVGDLLTSAAGALRRGRLGPEPGLGAGHPVRARLERTGSRAPHRRHTGQPACGGTPDAAHPTHAVSPMPSWASTRATWCRSCAVGSTQLLAIPFGEGADIGSSSTSRVVVHANLSRQLQSFYSFNSLLVYLNNLSCIILSDTWIAIILRPLRRCR